jgi:hypothetical protein
MTRRIQPGLYGIGGKYNTRDARYPISQRRVPEACGIFENRVHAGVLQGLDDRFCAGGGNMRQILQKGGTNGTREDTGPWIPAMQKPGVKAI